MKPAAAPRTPDCKGRAAERRDSGHGRGRLRCCGGTLCARSATMRWRATYPLLPLARSLSLPLHLLPMAREAQENGNARKAAKIKRRWLLDGSMQSELGDLKGCCRRVVGIPARTDVRYLK